MSLTKLHFCLLLHILPIMIFFGSNTYIIMDPAQPSKASLGGVNFIFRHIQICTRLLQGELFQVTMYTAYISSNWSHFLTARVLVSWTYKVSKFGYGRTKWMVTMYSKYTAHISSNGSHFLTAGVLVYWTYKVRKFGYGWTKWMVTMYSKYTALISSNKWKPLFDG